ncbi:hypothetical protein CDL15_Pgr004124 [Punica granatum]|uniref:Uncharacterized protein n=1 Tax=Punica granatum TaxID=22663 RepID=A0A218XFJ1_PUNGR|nr:hypothetical protein CDL15_Pgr004124 [Punica granatum]
MSERKKKKKKKKSKGRQNSSRRTFINLDSNLKKLSLGRDFKDIAEAAVATPLTALRSSLAAISEKSTLRSLAMGLAGDPVTTYLRFSLGGRISFDDLRYSSDDSWNVYLIEPSFPSPRMCPTILLVVEPLF